jgi:hypothetical protein
MYIGRRGKKGWSLSRRVDRCISHARKLTSPIGAVGGRRATGSISSVCLLLQRRRRTQAPFEFFKWNTKQKRAPNYLFFKFDKKENLRRKRRKKIFDPHNALIIITWWIVAHKSSSSFDITKCDVTKNIKVIAMKWFVLLSCATVNPFYLRPPAPFLKRKKQILLFPRKCFARNVIMIHPRNDISAV